MIVKVTIKIEKTFEIFFEKEYIFPYTYMDLVREQKKEYIDGNIYMIMLTNKLEIIKALFAQGRLFVQYKDLETKKVYQISNLVLFQFNIPDKFVKVEICDYGTSLEIELTIDGLEYINQNFSKMFYEHDFTQKKKVSIYDLLNISTQEVETKNEYKILYIGKSNPDNTYQTIFDRLTKHEKILQIYRDYNLKFRNKELMVFLLTAKYKLHNDISLDPLTTIMFGNSKWKTFDKIGMKITEVNLMDVTEAMLIYHFKPEYNIEFKNSIPNIKLKTYSQLSEAKVNNIYLGLNLYLQKYKNCINLYTDTESVFSKLRILHCNLNDLYKNTSQTSIIAEDISDTEYWLINH